MGDMSGSVSRPPRCCAWTRLAPARVDSAGLGHQWPPPMLPCDPINHGCVRRAGEAECQNVQAQRRKPASRARHAGRRTTGTRCATGALFVSASFDRSRRLARYSQWLFREACRLRAGLSCSSRWHPPLGWHRTASLRAGTCRSTEPADARPTLSRKSVRRTGGASVWSTSCSGTRRRSRPRPCARRW